MRMTIKQLTYFMALAETGSFGAAAQRVNISQPALSLQIKELEGHLGTRLVERLPRELRLTRAGHTLRDRAASILQDLRALESELRLQKGLTGRLALGVIPTIAPYLLPPALSRLRWAAPELDLRITEAKTGALLQGLADCKMDGAILALPIDDTGLETLPLFTDHLLLVGTDQVLDDFDGLPPHPGLLPRDRLLLLGEGHCLADQTLELCGLSARPAGLDMAASSLATLTGIVAQGMGYTLLPEIAVAAETAGLPDLRLHRFVDPEPARQVVLACRRTADAGWAEDLAQVFGEAGRSLLG